MVLAYVFTMSELRKVLSMNIKNARAALHITQTKLAIYSDISVPHMIEIEQCKTWVSDKTLSSIAKALNMEVYQLLIPEKSGQSGESGKKAGVTQQMARLVKTKKSELRKSIDDTMTGLIMELIKLNDGQSHP